MENILGLNEFFVEGKNQQKSHVILHITEPSTPDEKLRGYFFAICEISNASTNTIIKLQEIIDEIENNYYDPNLPADTTAIESVLQKVNHSSFSLLKPDVNLNCLVGVIKQSEIIFSFYGAPQMFLFYQNKHGLYQKLDLISQNQPEEANSGALFSQIIQGKIGINDYLFISTGQVANYFSIDRLEKIITTRPARQSAQHLERVLSELKNGWSFGGLIVNLQTNNAKTLNNEKKSILSKKISSTKSLHNFFDTERNTANILSPSLLPRLNDRLKSMSNNNSNAPAVTEEMMGGATQQHTQINAAHSHQHHNPRALKIRNNYREIMVGVANFTKIALAKLGQFLVWLAILIWNIITSIIRGIGLIFLLTTNYKNRRAVIIDNLRRQWSNYIVHIKQLPLITKILLVATTIVVIIFVSSIIYINHNRQKEQDLSQFNTGIATLKNQKDAANSALIYNNETLALSELQNARITFNTVCTKDKLADNTDCQALNSQLNDLAVKLRKEKTVTPQLLLDLKTVDVKLETSVFSKVDGKILALSPTSSSLIIYDILTKNAKQFTASIGATGFTATAVPKENDYALFLYNKKDLARFDTKDNSTKQIEVSYPDNNSGIAGITVYNRRLYTIDTVTNQIYKHDVIKTGFGRGSNWLKEQTDLSNSVDLTIDGDLFVLKNTGEILKFTAGVSQTFLPQGVEPALTSANEIQTYTDWQYLYILDSANKRIVILYKDGRIKQQITAKEWFGPSSMVVDEPNNVGYVLDNNKIYQFSLK